MKTTDDFKIGQEVIYVPSHAKDLSDPACEHGRVSSTNETFVFVKFDPSAAYGKACYPRDLQ